MITFPFTRKPTALDDVQVNPDHFLAPYLLMAWILPNQIEAITVRGSSPRSFPCGDFDGTDPLTITGTVHPQHDPAVHFNNDTADYFRPPSGVMEGSDDIFTIGATNFCVAGMFRPEDLVNNEDGRVISKDVGTAENDHDWMVGWADVGPNFRPRTRIKYSSTQTGTAIVAASGALNTVTPALIAGGMEAGVITCRSLQGTTFENATASTGALNYNSGSTIKIGRSAGAADNQIDAYVDLVCFFSKMLTEHEMRQWYNRPYELFAEIISVDRYVGSGAAAPAPDGAPKGSLALMGVGI